MRPTPSEISFKFQYVQQGYARGIFATKGLASDREILLGRETLSYDDIANVQVRDNRFIIGLSRTANPSPQIAQHLVDGTFLVLQLYGVKAIDFQRFVNAIASRKRVENLRREAIQSGQASAFHAPTCPECGATIGLSGFERVSSIYCPYCETIFRDNLQTIARGENYGICDECQMFDRVGSYTEFYLSPVSYSYKRHPHICDNCADSLFWRMLWPNLFLTLVVTGFAGLALAVLIKIRASTGRDPKLQDLAKANAFLKKRKREKATPIYTQLYEQYPEHPGLLMNEGIASWHKNDDRKANDYFQRSRRACPNYIPVLRWIQQLESGVAVATGTKGDDLRLDLRLAFREAILGVQKEVRVSHWEICDTCRGRQTTCHACKGTRRIQQTKKLQVEIPAGVDAGTRLRIAGEGDVGEGGGEAGDLYIYLDIEPDPKFQRD